MDIFNNKRLESLATLYKTLGDPVRLRIINMLLEGPICVKAICEVLDMSQPRVSRHMTVLRNAGLVDFKRRGKFVIYSMRFVEFCPDLFSCIKVARELYPVLKEDLERLEEVKKEVC